MDSWVGDHNDGDISWDQHESSDIPEPEFQPSMKHIGSHSQATFLNPRRKGSRNYSSQEPDLVMPLLENDELGRSTTSMRSSQLRHRNSRSRMDKSPSPSLMQRSTGQTARYRTTNRQSSSSSDSKVTNILVNILEWFLDIVGGTLKTLKRPISWILAAYLFAGLLTVLQNFVTNSISSALSPICKVPGVSLLSLPMCHYTSTSGDQPSLPGSPPSSSAPVEFDALMSTHSHFEDILASSASGVNLPFDMKRSETSIRDLRQIVRYSCLSSRHELVMEFDGFIETAREASYDIQRWNSHVGRGVDIVLSTARWTQRVLDDMALQIEGEAKGSALVKFFVDTLLSPFQPLQPSPQQFTEERLLDQYIKHTHIISEEIEKLISEAQAILLVLQNLEDRLDVIHSISLRDRISAQSSKDEVLTHLWTILGGNRQQLGKFNTQLRLLRQVGEYRKIAWAHVSGTILKLQAMGTELEELRTRVGAADLERQINGVGPGTGPGGRRERIPLSVHVENVKLGIERLEAERQNARQVERNHVRRVLESTGEGRDGMKLVGGD